MALNIDSVKSRGLYFKHINGTGVKKFKKENQMNLNYVKTLLYAYPHVTALTEQIDEIVLSKALLSIRDYSPCEEQCEKIIELTEQKKTLIDFKLRMDKVVNKLNEYELDCLDYKYFKQKPKENYIGFDASSRTYFRRQIRIVKKVNSLIEIQGINDEWFTKKCLRMSFFFELLRRVISAENALKKKKTAKKKERLPERQALSA